MVNVMNASVARRRTAFTLIELLVMIAIIAILIGLLLPAIQKVRESAARTKCMNSLKQSATAAHTYLGANAVFPPGTMNPYCSDDSTGDDNSTWFQYLLPYFEQEPLFNVYKQFQKDGGNMGFLYGGALASACKTIVPAVVCPSDPNGIKTVSHGGDQQGFHGNVAGNAGSNLFNTSGCTGDKLNGIFYWKSRVSITDIGDGSSNTLLFAEIRVAPDKVTHDTRGRYWNNGFQGSIIFSTLWQPNTKENDRLQWCSTLPDVPCEFGTTNIVQYSRSAHTGGVNVAMADGSVKFVRNTVDNVVWNAAGTRSGGESLTLP